MFTGILQYILTDNNGNFENPYIKHIAVRGSIAYLNIFRIRTSIIISYRLTYFFGRNSISTIFRLGLPDFDGRSCATF